MHVIKLKLETGGPGAEPPGRRYGVSDNFFWRSQWEIIIRRLRRRRPPSAADVQRPAAFGGR